ncbi:MAG: hypothetical protein DHS80DRAFT_22300 [Piptocephalis tieghemiana]|nr:MAG: hypothetical protein DHS80DRAFT_22300 [Piptocephalis tieghemiana]
MASSPPLASSLTQEQQARIEAAKAYARAIQPTLLAKLGGGGGGAGVLGQGTSSGQTLLGGRTTGGTGETTTTGCKEGSFGHALNVCSRVYVGSIPFGVGEGELRPIFEQYGAVRGVTMTVDGQTGRHKGFAFVEYEAPEAAGIAVKEMVGLSVGGRTLRVGRPNNYSESLMETLGKCPEGRIYVGRVPEAIREEDVHELFKGFGEVEGCHLVREAGYQGGERHKGYGYLQYKESESARSATASMDGFSIGGYKLYVRKAIYPVDLDELKAQTEMGSKGVGGVGVGGVGGGVGGGEGGKGEEGPAQEGEGGAGGMTTLAEESEVRIRNGDQRYAVMQRLAQSQQDVERNSAVLLIRDPVRMDEVDEELERDFREECTKYGQVKGVRVDAGEAETGVVRVFVEYEEKGDAVRAKGALNGRWFGGRQLEVRMYDALAYSRGEYGEGGKGEGGI